MKHTSTTPPGLERIPGFETWVHSLQPETNSVRVALESETQSSDSISYNIESGGLAG
jgi:hypothetical protein